MALLLQLETSTEFCSVSLAENGRLLYLEETNSANSHASLLTPMISACLQHAGKTTAQLDAVAISSGPGSYTSLRIGGATAKGICYGADLPLIALDSLLVLAAGIDPAVVGEEDVLLPMIDARRMEVYTCVFDKNLGIRRGIEAKILDSQSFNELSNGKNTLHICGNGAPKFLSVTPHSNIVMHHTQASSTWMTQLAWCAYKKKEFAEIAAFSPVYFKEANITVSKKKYFGS
jgi:tRNA threonylcarbamoyladenosine biosynthesis protein TsaB